MTRFCRAATYYKPAPYAHSSEHDGHISTSYERRQLAPQMQLTDAGHLPRLAPRTSTCGLSAAFSGVLLCAGASYTRCENPFHTLERLVKRLTTTLRALESLPPCATCITKRPGVMPVFSLERAKVRCLVRSSAAVNYAPIRS